MDGGVLAKNFGNGIEEDFKDISDRGTTAVKFSDGKSLEFEELTKEHIYYSSIKVLTCVRISRRSKVYVFRGTGVLRHIEGGG